ncbi:hypothetical protein E2C01_021875 [Portunus trituberculatus]|uniref:Uncharacterized protein n=1 Tax=Portunus trituberculatus TaxID=210409 RepID=A0A5B7E634_PORTR|nr:hypothetical protein [Portunus trituberculatus]
MFRNMVSMLARAAPVWRLAERLHTCSNRCGIKGSPPVAHSTPINLRHYLYRPLPCPPCELHCHV